MAGVRRPVLVPLLLSLVVVACATASPTPAPTLSSAPERFGALTVGADESSDLGRRARLLPAGSVSYRPGKRGVDALADTSQHAGTFAVVAPSVLAAQLLDGASPGVSELVPIARLPSEPLVFAVAKASAIADGAALKRRLKSDASTIRFAGSEIGGIEQQAAALVVKDATGGAAGLLFASYGSTKDAIAGVAGGQSDVLVARYADAKDAIGSGTLRALALSAPARVPGIDVPILREAQIDVALVDWAVLVGSPSLPGATVARYRDLITRTKASSAWADAVKANGWIDDTSTDGLTTFVGTELSRATSLYSELGLRR